jgi:hypothetical protein
VGIVIKGPWKDDDHDAVAAVFKVLQCNERELRNLKRRIRAHIRKDQKDEE